MQLFELWSSMTHQGFHHRPHDSGRDIGRTWKHDQPLCFAHRWLNQQESFREAGGLDYFKPWPEKGSEQMRTVTLLSDFGLQDSYVAQMKGVILRICQSCHLVDITHDVRPHDILMGAFILETAVPFFPMNTVHVAVVDPGVGGPRLPLAIVCKGSMLVGPDNGVLMRAARKLGIVKAYKIQSHKFEAESVSTTFHGRDIFAVAAARLADGVQAERLGPRVPRPVELDISPAIIGRDSLTCRVLHVDRFGNVITNAENGLLRKLGVRLGQRVQVKCKKHRFHGSIATSYSNARRGHMIVIQGSQGYVEVAVRERNAASLMKLRPKDQLEIMLSVGLVGRG